MTLTDTAPQRDRAPLVFLFKIQPRFSRKEIVLTESERRRRWLAKVEAEKKAAQEATNFTRNLRAAIRDWEMNAKLHGPKPPRVRRKRGDRQRKQIREKALERLPEGAAEHMKNL